MDRSRRMGGHALEAFLSITSAASSMSRDVSRGRSVWENVSRPLYACSDRRAIAVGACTYPSAANPLGVMLAVAYPNDVLSRECLTYRS